MKTEDYSDFSIEELIDDSYFRCWVKEPNLENENFWKSYLLEHPHQEEKILLARNLLLSIQDHFGNEQNMIEPAQAKRSFQNIVKDLPPNHKLARSKRKLIGWSVVASSVLILVICLIFWENITPEQLVYTTGHGQRMELILPDSSTVQLNANSKLTYDNDSWITDEAREVLIEGEAFFSVRKKQAVTKFIVHAGDLKISVIGTEFNVRARDEKAQVVLAEGKVELTVADQHIDMKPGDMISYSNKQRIVESKKVQALDYAAWKDGITVFNNSLLEVTKELEALFGVRFIFKDKSIMNRHIQLSAPTDDINQVLEILSLVYKDEIAIDKVDHEIFINIPK